MKYAWAAFLGIASGFLCAEFLPAWISVAIMAITVIYIIYWLNTLFPAGQE